MAKKLKSKTKSEKGNVKVITGVCRSSYMYCRELTVNEKSESDVKTCRTQILIPKKDKETVKAIQAAIEAAAQKKFGNDVNVDSKKFKNPLRDGDEELEDGDMEGQQYVDHYFVNATGYKLPGVVDDDGDRILDPDELDEIVVSGYYFRFSIVAKAFDNESRGVRFVLNNLMFKKEGDRLDGSVNAENEDWSD